MSSRVIQNRLISSVVGVMKLRSVGRFIHIIRGKGRIGKVGEEILVTVFGLLEESLVNTAEEPTLTTLLEARRSTWSRAGKPTWFGGKALRRTGFGNKRTVTNVRVIMIFGGMHLATDVTSLGINPALAGRAGALV